MNQERHNYIKEIKEFLITLEKNWSEEEINELDSFDETQLMYEATVLRYECVSSREDYVSARNTLVQNGLIKDRYKFDEDQFYQIDSFVEKCLAEIGNNTPACNHCNGIEFELNKINGEKLLFECSNCKNSINISAEVFNSFDDKVDFDGILSNYFSTLTEVFDYYTYSEDLINFFSDKFYKYNPLKGGLCGIRLKANSEINYETVPESDLVSKKSRRISPEVQDRVWKRDEGKCVKCGSNENLEFDHIIPFSKGGSNTYRNIQLLCEKCNRSKSNNF